MYTYTHTYSQIIKLSYFNEKTKNLLDFFTLIQIELCDFSCNDIIGVNDVLKKLARINDIKGLPSRFEVRTARTMAATQLENEMKMKIENQRIADEELEKLRSKDRNLYNLNFKTALKTEKTVLSIPGLPCVNTAIEDPVPDSMKKSLCVNLKCLVGKVRVIFSLIEGTALNALTLLLRYHQI